MKIEKILDLENDGKQNMIVDSQFLYVRSRFDMRKYNLTDMSLKAKNTVFKKDGRARSFSIHNDLIFLVDYLDLFILRKDDLHIIDVVRLGENASSDISEVLWFDAPRAYVLIRHGCIYVLDIETKNFEKYETINSSFWAYCIVGNSLFAGTVKGELIDINRNELNVTRKTTLGRMNIYGVVHHGDMLYTLSQDKTLKEVDIATFETIRVLKKVASGMSAIAGICNETLVVVDSGNIVLRNIKTLQPLDKFTFPMGEHNSGVLLAGNKLFGHDRNSVYSCTL